jgi:hypothetical protein
MSQEIKFPKPVVCVCVWEAVAVIRPRKKMTVPTAGGKK